MTSAAETTPFRAGLVALVGKPNVGKSTLMNALLTQKVAAVSPRPQTTRRRQLGILTQENAQIIFTDTPGLHAPRHKLGDFMNHEAQEGLKDSDVIVWLVDQSQQPDETDQLAARAIAGIRRTPTLLALNKTDLIAPDSAGHAAAYRALLPKATAFPVSAATRGGLDDLLQAIIAKLPQGEPFYGEDEITDFYERDIAADLIREAALIVLRDEVPHGIAIRIDEFTERETGGAYIAATLFVERESHKGIVIGKGGEMLKRIGTKARHEIESMSGRQVYLELRVKVNKNWRDNLTALQRLGYRQPKS